MTSGRTARVQEGERNSRRDVRPATDGREDTGGTGHIALGFVDLDKKAFDTVPREMVMVTLRWMGVPEAEVRMVEGVYEKTTARVVVGEGSSEEFEVNMDSARCCSYTVPHKQEYGYEGCHEETPLCRRPGPGGEWQTGATSDTGGVERTVYLTRAEDKPREDGSAARRPPEGRAGHRAGGEETDSGGQFRVHRRGSVRRREDGERCVEEHRPERTRGEQLRGDGGPVDLKKTQGQGREHLCDTGMPVRNGNPWH